MEDYYVIFRTSDAMDETAHNNVAALNTDDPMELDEVILHCETLGCNADLFDEQGFHTGWIHADGIYHVQ